MTDTRVLLDAAGINRALRRIAHELVERNATATDLVLVGIRSAGVPLSERLARMVADTGERAAPGLGAIDITLYRDDVFEGLPRPQVGSTELPHGGIAGRNVVLIDDVLYTGRTIRAALDALMDYGRPRRVELAVLVDRGRALRELPIQPDYAGLVVDVDKSQNVKVQLTEQNAPVDRAVVRERKSS